MQRGGLLRPQELAELMLHSELNREATSAADLDGDGKVTSADLLLHTLGAAGAWKPGASRPGKPVVMTRVVRPGRSLRIAPPPSDAVLILGVSTTTRRLARSAESSGNASKDWMVNVPEDIPAGDEPLEARLWWLADRILSAPAFVAVQNGPSLRSAVLEASGNLRIAVANLIGSPEALKVAIGDREWTARREDDATWVAESVKVTAPRAVVRVSDAGGRSNSVPLHRRTTLRSGDSA